MDNTLVTVPSIEARSLYSRVKFREDCFIGNEVFRNANSEKMVKKQKQNSVKVGHRDTRQFRPREQLYVL